MRQIGLADLQHAARAVLGMPVPQRERFCDLLLWRAHVADKCVKRLGKLHPEWGDGRLGSVALAWSGARSKALGGAELCLGIEIVLAAVARWRCGRKL
ncbi:hypothetical protein [Sulfitobacter sp.]|uniref:DUF7742 family protein n=1 Tax=Sulfitobacter sp. TaxID=1903071 RepID=UPI003297BACD